MPDHATTQTQLGDKGPFLEVEAVTQICAVRQSGSGQSFLGRLVSFAPMGRPGRTPLAQRTRARQNYCAIRIQGIGILCLPRMGLSVTSF